jgi:hypothetical protein
MDLASGMEELKRRLEVLLGAKPTAPIDESEKARIERQAAEMAKKERISAAGGHLLGAAFGFMGEMLAQQRETEQSTALAEVLKEKLAQCLERGEDGKLKMTITLPDEGALDTLARSLAQMLGTH